MSIIKGQFSSLFVDLFFSLFFDQTFQHCQVVDVFLRNSMTSGKLALEGERQKDDENRSIETKNFIDFLRKLFFEIR